MSRLRCEQLESRHAPAILSFRAGDGFTISDDTYIAASAPQTPQPSAAHLEVAGESTPTGTRQALLRFPNLFGNGPHQIPTSATLTSATLSLWANGGNSNTVPIQIFHNFTSWTDNNATWDYFNNGLQADNTELWTTPNVTQNMSQGGFQFSKQILIDSLFGWQNGQPIGGWAIVANDPNAQWSFASGEDPDPSRRPTLTVEFTIPGVRNPAYEDLAGQPPSPLKSAWFDWADDLRQRRLDRVPNSRTSTYYFAQNGDDVFGKGSIDSPWKSLAKAQQILSQKPIDTRFRFRRGDVWRESTTIALYSNGITIDDYGDANLPKPLFTRFQPVAGGNWSGVANNVYKTSGFTTVGWIREAADGFSRVYYRAGSLTELAMRPYSWWFDSSGSEPSSGGQPTLYANANGNPASVVGGLEVAPGDGVGWSVIADNVRLQNLRIEGQGMAQDGFGYGLSVGQRDLFWEFVGQGLEVYYTGYHSIGHIVQYQGSTGVMTLVDCKAGYCTNRYGNGAPGGGDITVFVSYGDWGGNEYYQYNCEAVSGALPSSDWAAQPGMRHGQGLYTHVGQGGQMRLLLCWKTAAGTQSENPVSLLNQLDNSAAANSLDDIRAYIVEDKPGPIASWWHKAGTACINTIIDRQTIPPPLNPYSTIMYYGPFSIGGYLINCTVKVDAQSQFNGQLDFLYSGTDSTKYINCQIDISNSTVLSYFRNKYLSNMSSFGSTITNTIISIQSTGETGLNAVNDANHLINNAYYLPQSPQYQFSGDLGGVVLPQRFAAGMIPSPSNPMFDGGTYTGLEYDQNRQPRGNRKTIGPLNGAALPQPANVSIGWGVQSMTLGNNSVVPSNKADRITLVFPSDVDVKAASLRLMSMIGEVSLGAFTYQPATRTATWTLANPLPRGTYVLELDSQPLKGFRVLPGDLDGNGVVAASDFILFRLYLGGNNATADFDGDGTVSAADFINFRLFLGTSL